MFDKYEKRRREREARVVELLQDDKLSYQDIANQIEREFGGTYSKTAVMKVNRKHKIRGKK